MGVVAAELLVPNSLTRVAVRPVEIANGPVTGARMGRRSNSQGAAAGGVIVLALLYGACTTVLCGSPRSKAPPMSLHSASSDAQPKPVALVSTKPSPPPTPAPAPEPVHPKKHGKRKAAKHDEPKAAAHSPTSDELFEEVQTKPEAEARVTTPTRSCCKYCSTGQPCGDSCISASKTCRKGPGCAC